MQENNVIYEITKQIQDKDNFQKDIKQAFDLVSDMFKKKYIDKIENEFQNKLDYIEKNPSKEITLLNTLKLFLEKDNHKNIDDTIDMIKKFSVINSFATGLKTTIEKGDKKELGKEQNGQEVLIATAKAGNDLDESIKEDGIYDIDESCIFGIKNTDSNGFGTIILMIFLLIIMFNFQ